jgi:sarcosine oxidase, subunit beta
MTATVVIGGGVIGLSVARALTARGAGDVLVCERATLASGGTGKSSGIVRCHYGAPSLAALALASLPFFEAAGQEVGFRQVGYIVGVGPENEAALAANTAMQAGLGIDVGLVGAGVVADLWPQLELGDFAAFSYEPRGGYADASQTAFLFGRQARAAGARIRPSAPVARLIVRDDRVRGVEFADGSQLESDTVVLAAGVWSAGLLDPLGVKLPVRAERAELLLIDAGEPLRDRPVLSDLVSLQYARTEGSGELLAGSSDHSQPEYADADHYSNHVGSAGMEKAAAKVLHRFPGFPDPRVCASYAGCYDVTPDYNPVIAPVGPRGLILAAGFSGHGFKISPAVGELVADLILDGDSRRPDVRASDFELSRFDRGEPLTSLHPYRGAGEMR